MGVDESKNRQRESDNELKELSKKKGVIRSTSLGKQKTLRKGAHSFCRQQFVAIARISKNSRDSKLNNGEEAPAEVENLEATEEVRSQSHFDWSLEDLTRLPEDP